MMQKWEEIATGRSKSLFRNLVDEKQAYCQEFFQDRSIMVVGAAGSIGASVVRNILRYDIRRLALVDVSENNLVEVTRELRSDANVRIPEMFEVLPIAMGSVEFSRYIAENEPFDYFMNLSAIKHVRSEKNIYSLIRMLDTNVYFLHKLLEDVPYAFKKVFSVSSDKGANPANLMGASKLVMEQVLAFHAQKFPFASARFANVAFSDGSLPYGFLHRIEKDQPIAAPRNILRYFISHEEAGQLCLLAFVLGNNEIFYPSLEEKLHEKDFVEIAKQLLRHKGYEAVEFESEAEAKLKLPKLKAQGQWPCVFLDSDTTGEKPFEEFFSEEEEIDASRFSEIGVIKKVHCAHDKYIHFIEFLEKAKVDKSIKKTDYIAEISKLVPGLKHIEKDKTLDQKM